MDARCERVREMIQVRLDGQALQQHERETLTSHLDACTACRAFARDLERAVSLVQRLPSEAAPPALVSQIMQRVPLSQRAPSTQTRWLERVGASWAPLAGLAGVLLLTYQTAVARGMSLINLPRAIGEWAELIDLSNVESLLQATSLFAWSVSTELLLGLTLVIVAVFAMIAQAMARPPSLGVPPRRHRFVS